MIFFSGLFDVIVACKLSLDSTFGDLETREQLEPNQMIQTTTRESDDEVQVTVPARSV